MRCPSNLTKSDFTMQKYFISKKERIFHPLGFSSLFGFDSKNYKMFFIDTLWIFVVVAHYKDMG